MSNRPVTVRRDIPSGTIVLDNPERRNALSREMVGALRDALFDLHGEREVRAVILTAVGDCFSSGSDLTELETSADDPLHSAADWHADAQAFRDLLLVILRFPKPVIAALPGSAWGAGVTLALAADLMIASPDTQLSYPEGRRGLTASLGIPLLSFRLNASLAGQLAIGGRSLSADEAARLGLFMELVPPEQLWARAHQMSEQIARQAPESVTQAKRTLLETAGEMLETHLSVAAAAQAASRTTEAAQIGISAFLAKHAPTWP